MMSALALNCRALEKDASEVATLTVKCAKCDPDNPRSVPRLGCRACGGSGRARVAAAHVVGEIHAARLEMLRGGKNGRRSRDDDPELDD